MKMEELWFPEILTLSIQHGVIPRNMGLLKDENSKKN
jgi:hypothetical protein